jgi:polysaccharide pyruvyl transferase CsaB
VKAVVAGYHGFGNVGDELLARAAVSAIRRRDPAARITLLANAPSAASAVGADFVSMWSPLAIFTAILRSDRLVFGGGGLFQDHTSRRSLLYYLAVMGMGRLAGKPVGLANVGVDPLRSRPLAGVLRSLLTARGVSASVRDEASLAAVGVSRLDAEVTADGVFSLDLDGPRGPARSDLVVVRPPPSGAGPLPHLLAAIGGAGTATAAFQPGEDERAAEALASGAGAACDGLLTATTAPGAIAAAERVVSARYHALVLAAITGRPFLGVGDPGKVRSVCAAFGMPYLPWDADASAARRAVEALRSAAAPDPAVVAGLRAKALRGYEIALGSAAAL